MGNSKKQPANVVELAQPSERFELVSENPEVFDMVVFHRDGTVSIQTNQSIYFYCTALFSAALDTARLLKGREARYLEYGIIENMINDPDDNPQYLCVDRDKIEEAIAADVVTSNWPKVAEFMVMLKSIDQEVNSSES